MTNDMYMNIEMWVKNKREGEKVSVCCKGRGGLEVECCMCYKIKE